MKILAFYLPQFHPIAENDAWWGKGFTEWRSVVTARPRFHGHHQPQIPADIGFYDLRLEETRIAQANIAREYGIYGFCYYHYWFNGKMLLERPFNEVLESGRPDFPFCLCWANENWTRTWDGMDKHILIQQDYNQEDRISHIKWLCRAFEDRRYIKINNKPLLLIYRTDNITDLQDRIRDWRTYVKEYGFDDIYICAVQSNFVQVEDSDLINLGFNAVVEFQPYYKDFPKLSISAYLKLAVRYNYNKLLMKLHMQSFLPLLNENSIYSYANLVSAVTNKRHPLSFIKFPCVTPSWDNSARRRQATIIQNNDPDKFQQWLESALSRVNAYQDEEKIVFINAWNEWAEGCHLEPDIRNGRRFLEAVKKALRNYGQNIEINSKYI